MTSSAPDTAHNAADVDFATGMVPHHAQGVRMADMALAAASDAELAALATVMRNAQAAEIATMTGWLQQWDAPVPRTGTGMGTGTDGPPGATHGTGMMSATDMTSLDGLAGSAFDRMWLTMMTRHHEGAIEMARTELAEGQDPRATALADRIVATQTAEITQMAEISQRLA